MELGRSFNYSGASWLDGNSRVCDNMRAHRVCGRAVECTGLENRRAEKHREFESHRTRQNKNNGLAHMCALPLFWDKNRAVSR